MDEPTDRALAIQGLGRRDYDSLAPQAKEMISGRGRKVVDLSDITLIADLLNTIAETDEESRMLVAEIIDGKKPEFEDKIRHLIREYLNAKVESSIKDYYKIRHGGTDYLREPKAEAKKDFSGLATKPQVYEERAPERQQTVAEQTVRVPAQIVKPDVPSAASPPQSAVASQPQPIVVARTPSVSTAISHGTTGDRVRSVAAIMSQTEKRDVETIMRIDADIIKTIMTVTDENAPLGVSDESVVKAAQTMISEGKGVQFCMEALLPVNRARLLEIAKVMK